nr:uncharacterized protein LOC112789634 isoform X2 [Arachis hypogaea]
MERNPRASRRTKERNREERRGSSKGEEERSRKGDGELESQGVREWEKDAATIKKASTSSSSCIRRCYHHQLKLLRVERRETTPLALSGIAAAVQATTRVKRRCVKGGYERSRTRTGRRRARRLEGGSAAAVAARACRWNSWSPLSLLLVAGVDKLLRHPLHFDSEPPFISLLLDR